MKARPPSFRCCSRGTTPRLGGQGGRGGCGDGIGAGEGGAGPQGGVLSLAEAEFGGDTASSDALSVDAPRFVVHVEERALDMVGYHYHWICFRRWLTSGWLDFLERFVVI